VLLGLNKMITNLLPVSYFSDLSDLSDLEEIDEDVKMSPEQEGKITATTEDQSGKLRIYLIFFHTSYFRIFYCCH
jgi:hypothetical protein